MKKVFWIVLGTICLALETVEILGVKCIFVKNHLGQLRFFLIS